MQYTDRGENSSSWWNIFKIKVMCYVPRGASYCLITIYVLDN